MDTFWLSFADPKKPQGEQFLGACVVEADDLKAAVIQAHVKGINPGGEVLGLRTDTRSAILIPEKWKNRLLSKAECATFDEEMLRLQDADGPTEPFQPQTEVVCTEHNERLYREDNF